MSDLLLTRLSDVLTELAERCESVIQSAHSNRSGVEMRTEAWAAANGLSTLLRQAAPLCVQLDWMGEMEQLRQFNAALSSQLMNIILYDFARDKGPEAIASLEEKYGPIGIWSGDLNREIGLQTVRWTMVFGIANQVDGLARSLLQTIERLAVESNTLDQTPERENVRTKRSTANGDAQAKLVAAITVHHQYENVGAGSIMNQDRAVLRVLADVAKVSKSTASEFIKASFGSYHGYEMTCRNRDSLINKLRKMNGDQAPRERQLDTKSANF